MIGRYDHFRGFYGVNEIITRDDIKDIQDIADLRLDIQGVTGVILCDLLNKRCVTADEHIHLIDRAEEAFFKNTLCPIAKCQV